MLHLSNLTGFAKVAWASGTRILDKHTDLISSCGILAITTCLLADKIFKGMPAIFPNLSRIVFNYGGIIWLNVQVRDFIKSGRDWLRAMELKQWVGLLETTLKVSIKAFGIFLTCTNFACSVITAVGYAPLSLAIITVLRPLALASLAGSILADVRDYFVNDQLLRQFERLEKFPDAVSQISDAVIAILEVMKGQKNSRAHDQRVLADRVVRQLSCATLETFQEGIAVKKTVDSVRQEALKLYFLIKDSLQDKQGATKSTLSLTVFNYIAMGICRTFPETIVDWSTRWCTSMLATDDLIRNKLDDADLATALTLN